MQSADEVVHRCLRNFIKFTDILQVFYCDCQKQPFRGGLSKSIMVKGALKICRKFKGEHQCRSDEHLLWTFFSEHLLLRTPLDGCFWIFVTIFRITILQSTCKRLLLLKRKTLPNLMYQYYSSMLLINIDNSRSKCFWE